MRVIVAYESKGGRTKKAAEAVAEALRLAECEVDVRSIGDLPKDDAANADLLVLGTWVEGFILFGVKPARAMSRWAASLPSLPGKPVGLLCTYAFNPRNTLAQLQGIVEGKGARVIAQTAFHRNRPDAGASEFARELLAAKT